MGWGHTVTKCVCRLTNLCFCGIFLGSPSLAMWARLAPMRRVSKSACMCIWQVWFKRGREARGLLISCAEWRGRGDPGVFWGHHIIPLLWSDGTQLCHPWGQWDNKHKRQAVSNVYHVLHMRPKDVVISASASEPVHLLQKFTYTFVNKELSNRKTGSRFTYHYNDCSSRWLMVHSKKDASHSHNLFTPPPSTLWYV